ncbi:MAG: hypothetical protein ACPG7F_03735, partial [Aggregatilineales bacterium]
MIAALYHSFTGQRIIVPLNYSISQGIHLTIRCSLLLVCILVLLTACDSISPATSLPDHTALPAILPMTAPPTTVLIATAIPAPTASALPPDITDELAIMRGICFESAYDAAGQVFILRDAAELNAFYDGADNSQLCRRAVKRNSFDFSTGHILAVLWTRGSGCRAWHNVINQQRDDAAKTLAFSLQFVEQGDCNYELVRPFIISIPGAADYAISIEITERIRV